MHSLSDLVLPFAGLVGSDFLTASLALVPLLLLTKAFTANRQSQEDPLIDVTRISYFVERTPLLQALRPVGARSGDHGK